MQQQQRETTAEQVLPPEASRSGKNATYIGCEVRHARQNYGVCLFVIKAHDENTLDQNMKDCARAITGGYCQAETMRQKEKEAGRALFYKEREIKVAVVADKPEQASRPVNKNSPSYIRGWNAVSGKTKNAIGSSQANTTPVCQSKPKPKAKAKSDFEKGLASESDGLVKALNKAASAETQSVKKTEPPAKQTTENPSDARIKRAMRIAKLMKGKQNAK